MGRLSDRAFAAISGSTDSEFLFALFLDSYRDLAVEEDTEDTERIAEALRTMILKVERLKEEAGVREPSFLNLAVTDGASAVISRYVSPGEAEANTLYVHAGGSCECTHRQLHLIKAKGRRKAVIVASEPLTEKKQWMEVPGKNLLVINKDLHIDLTPI